MRVNENANANGEREKKTPKEKSEHRNVCCPFKFLQLENIRLNRRQKVKERSEKREIT